MKTLRNALLIAIAGLVTLGAVVTNNFIVPNINLQMLRLCGKADVQTALTAAATLAGVTGQNLYIPGGCQINHSTTLTIGVSLIGDGIGSIFNATDTASSDPHHALIVTGTGTVVRGINFRTTNTVPPRSTQPYTSAILSTTGLTQCSIDHNYFTTQFAGADIQFNAAGSWCDVAANQVIVGPLANAMIFQGSQIQHTNIRDNLINGGGDSCIELTYDVFYVNVANNNLNSCGAHGVGVIGAVHSIISGNNILNPVGRCIDVEADGAFTLANIANVSIVHNNCKGSGAGFSASIFVNGDASHAVTDVLVAMNTVEVTTAISAAIGIGQCSDCSSAKIWVNRATVVGNVLIGDATNAINGIVASGVNDLTIDGGSISGFQSRGVSVATGNSGVLKILGIHFSNLNNLTGAHSAILLGNSTGFASVLIANNSLTDGAVPVNFFLFCGTGNPTVMFTSTVGTRTDQSGCTLDKGSSLQVPSTGFSITIANSVETLILKPAGTLATGTITMPAAPTDRQIARVSSSQTVTSLTVSPNSGQSINGAPTTIAATGGFSYIYNLSDTTWYRLN